MFVGLSHTPENPISEGPPIQLIDPTFRPRNSTAPQPTLDYLYQPRHVSAQRQRSNNLPPSSRIDFSVKLHIKPTQCSFGLVLGDGAVVEKVPLLCYYSNKIIRTEETGYKKNYLTCRPQVFGLSKLEIY